MGVKSTVDLTRAEAEQKFVDLMRAAQDNYLRGIASDMPNNVLEEELEMLNDHVKGGEGFENYMISD